MVSNNDIYSKLQGYKNELDNYVEQRKKHPNDLRASPAFDNIFRDIQAINGLNENTAALTSEAARSIFPKPTNSILAPDQNKVLKREIRHLNKSIVSAKYQSEIQGLNIFQRIPVWFKYHFYSPEKLGIARLDVRHLVDLMKAANVKTDVTGVTTEKLQNTSVKSDSEAIGQLNTVVQKLGGAAANGTYLLLEDKSGIYIIETEGNQSKFVKYTFKDENGLCAVYDNHKTRVGTFKDRESFLKQKQVDAAIAYIKDPKIKVEKDRNAYIQLETGRTKEGKEITLILKNSDGLVATNQYILPNGITSGTSSYFNREEFFQAKAKELHVPFKPTTVGSGQAERVDTVETARAELQNKPAGTWISTFPDAKSESVFLIVVDDKNTIKEFTFKETSNKAPDTIRPFLEATTTKQISSKEVVSYTPITAQQKRIQQGEALKRFIVESSASESNLRSAMLDADKSTQGKASFVLKAKEGNPITEFILIARPTGVNTFDSNRTIKVLPEGRIQHDAGRIFENFEAYKASELLSASLPEALIQQSLGAPVLKSPNDLNIPASTYLFWADKSDPTKLFLSNRTATGVETYQIGNMKFDTTGEATFQLVKKDGSTLTVKQSKLAQPFGDKVLSAQQREVVGRLSDHLSKERLEKKPADLVKNAVGYLLTPGKSASLFSYKVVDTTGFFTSENDFTLEVLPDGKIAKSKDGAVEHFTDMTTFQNAVNGLAGKKSIKDLAHFDKVGEAIAKEIKKHVETIIKPISNSWPTTESEARATMEEAKTLDLPQNQAIYISQGKDSPRMTILFQRDGVLNAIPCDVQQNGKLVVTVPGNNITTTYETIDDVLKANGLVKAQTLLKDIADKKAIIQAGVDKLKATDGFDSDNTAASRITEALTSHIEEHPSMDAMVGAWMLAEVVEITPATWFFQSDTINKTGRFKLAVNVGDKEEDMKIVEHTITVNSKGEFIVDNDATKPKKTIDEVLTSVQAKKDLSLGKLRAIEDKWKTLEDEVKSDTIGSYVAPENIDLMQVWETQFKTKDGAVLITDNGSGQYSLSCKNGQVSIDFSTRDVPGKVVDSTTSRQYNTVRELVAAYESRLQPWKTEHARNLAAAEANAPKAPGLKDVAYNAAAGAASALWNLGWSWVGTSNQPAQVLEPVSAPVNQSPPKVQQQQAAPSPQPKAPQVQPQVAQPAAPQQPVQQQAQAKVPDATVGPALTNMKPTFMNGDKYYKFKGANVVKAQKALMKQLITWKEANTTLSSQDAKAALKMLLLNDNYEQSEGFNTLEAIQALALDILPTPAGVNKNGRNQALAWLWSAAQA